jgi:hypothetical protein
MATSGNVRVYKRNNGTSNATQEFVLSTHMDLLNKNVDRLSYIHKESNVALGFGGASSQWTYMFQYQLDARIGVV